MNKLYSVNTDLSNEHKPSRLFLYDKNEYKIDNVSVESFDPKVFQVLSPAIDIFSEIPEQVYKNERANLFLKVLRRHLQEIDVDNANGLVLSKINVSEDTESRIILEWIFNYFRFYYAFDDYDGDYHGLVINNPNEDSFKNEVVGMKKEEYASFAQRDLQYAIRMIEGNSDDISK